MLMLEVAAAAFLGIHLLIAGTRARDAITGLIGEVTYRGLFAMASAVTFIWLCLAYNAAQASGNDTLIYNFGRGVHDMGIVVIAIAFWLGVQGLLLANPTFAGQEQAGTVKGVLRITRHPILWGVILWASFHLAANGDMASVILFGTFLLLALFGTFTVDAKRARKLGPAWSEFAAQTSNIPFAAVIAGRTRLKLSESFGWRFWVALILFVAVLFAHSRIFGVSPFPGGYVPR